MNWFYLIWLLPFLMSVVLFTFFWKGSSSLLSFVAMIVSITMELVRRSLSGLMGGAASLFTSLFLMLILLNLLGLVPYVFSLTSHLAINLAISLPLWLGIMTMGGSYDLGTLLAHFQPMGSPTFLNPFLCVIELLSNLVRPVTLAVRLTANLSTGHILMGLLGLGFVSSKLVGMMLIVGLGMFYFMFEMGVCFVQAYIFMLLPTLYSDEHPSNSHL